MTPGFPVAAPRRTHYAQGWAAQREKLDGDLAKGAARPGSCSAGTRILEAATWGNWGGMRGPQSGHWLSRRRSARRKLRCNVKRPACRCRHTGACGTCGAAADVQQPCRRRGGTAGAMCSLQPQGADGEAGQPLRKLDSMGERIRDAVLFLSATSLTTKMRRLVEIPPWDRDSW